VAKLVEKQSAQEANEEEERRWWAEYDARRSRDEEEEEAKGFAAFSQRSGAQSEVWDVDDMLASAPAHAVQLRQSRSAPRLRVSTGPSGPVTGSPLSHSTLPRSPTKVVTPQLSMRGSPLAASPTRTGPLSLSQSVAVLPVVKRSGGGSGVKRPSSSKHGHPARIAPAHMSLSSADVPVMLWLQDKMDAAARAEAQASPASAAAVEFDPTEVERGGAPRPVSGSRQRVGAASTVDPQASVPIVPAPLAAFVPPVSPTRVKIAAGQADLPSFATQQSPQSPQGKQQAQRPGRSPKTYFKPPSATRRPRSKRPMSPAKHDASSSPLPAEHFAHFEQHEQHESNDVPYDEDNLPPVEHAAPAARTESELTQYAALPEASTEGMQRPAEELHTDAFAPTRLTAVTATDDEFAPFLAGRERSPSAPLEWRPPTSAAASPALGSLGLGARVAVAAPAAASGTPVHATRHVRSFTMMSRLGSMMAAAAAVAVDAGASTPAGAEEEGQHANISQGEAAASAPEQVPVSPISTPAHAPAAGSASASSLHNVSATGASPVVPASSATRAPPPLMGNRVHALPVPARVEQSVYCRPKVQPFVNHPMHKF